MENTCMDELVWKSHPVTYSKNVNWLARFRDVCPKLFLLEKTDVDSKAQLHTQLIVKPSLHIICRGNHVEIHAVSESAIDCFDWIAERLPAFKPTRLSNTHLQLHCPVTSDPADEDERLRQSSCMDALRLFQQLQLEGDRKLLLGGYFAFDLMAQFEPAPFLESDGENPDYEFFLAETWLDIDHQAQTAVFSTCGMNGDSKEWAAQRRQLNHFAVLYEAALSDELTLSSVQHEVEPDISDAEYERWVTQTKENIESGDVFQLVLSRTFSYSCTDPLANYLKLREVNFSPYMFYLQIDNWHAFGASPETAVKYCPHNNQVEVCPIAGTRPRGKYADGLIDHDLDTRLEVDLKQDEKEVAEHLMLVDLCRNDIARISQTGSRQVKDLLKVDRYSHVMHLVSRVTGQLREELDALAAYQACMNMGTLVGAPKVRALQILRSFEGKRRNLYGGAVAVLGSDGEMDSCIAIRCAVVRDGVAYVQAGAGIVYDSSPVAEAQETYSKARAVFQSQASINTYPLY